MTSFSVDSLINSSLVDVFCKYASNFTTYLSSAVGFISFSDSPKVTSETFLYAFGNLHDFLSFDEFQLKLLKGFVFLFIFNLFLIYFFWRIYGKRICERFMKPGKDCDSDFFYLLNYDTYFI